MLNKISYEEAGTSTEVETLLNYCIEGAIENIDMNGGSLKEWCSGSDVFDVYLSHNNVLDDSQKSAICGMLDNFLALNSELDLEQLLEIIE